MNDINLIIADRVRKARRSRGISQMGLAEMLQVRQGTVSGWENGKSKIRADYLYGLAKVLGKPIKYFLWIS